jgi:hypothetical protein
MASTVRAISFVATCRSRTAELMYTLIREADADVVMIHSA